MRGDTCRTSSVAFDLFFTSIAVQFAAEGLRPLEASTSEAALGFERDTGSRMARSYPLNAVVGNDDIKEVLQLNEENKESPKCPFQLNRA